MSSYTSISDHCNSALSSRSVIHSEPLLNVNVYGKFGLKLPGCYGDLPFVTYSSNLHSFLCPHFGSKMFDVGDLPVQTFGTIVYERLSN